MIVNDEIFYLYNKRVHAIEWSTVSTMGDVMFTLMYTYVYDYHYLSPQHTQKYVKVQTVFENY